MSVYEKIKNGDYQPKSPCPESLRRPRLADNPTSGQAEAYAKALKEYEARRDEFNAQRNVYLQEANELEAQFMRDAIEEVFGDDAKNYPNLINFVWQKAWEEGHVAGLEDVYSHLCDFQEIIDALRKDSNK